jgi:Mg2+ and Co2+ transporter CorA
LLKTKLVQYGHDFIQKIIGHLVDESKTDLNNLLQEFEDTANELMQHPNKLDHLKKNKDLMNDVQSRLAQMGGRRDPIKKKFAYIQDLIESNEGNNIELTPDEKMKLEGLDDAWLKFKDDLDKAKQIINRCHQQLKTEVDNSIEDFKKECQDNKKNF